MYNNTLILNVFSMADTPRNYRLHAGFRGSFHHTPSASYSLSESKGIIMKVLVPIILLLQQRFTSKLNVNVIFMFVCS